MNADSEWPAVAEESMLNNSMIKHGTSSSHTLQEYDESIRISFTSHTDTYRRPSSITNSQICVVNKKSGEYVLKKNLQEMYDYVKVSEGAWEYLKVWYGADYDVIV